MMRSLVMHKTTGQTIEVLGGNREIIREILALFGDVRLSDIAIVRM
jgi:hypothetical protein